MKSRFYLKNNYFFLLLFVLFVIGCSPAEKDQAPSVDDLRNHPAWTKSANLYEVNIRQYTREGTFNAFAGELPRLKKMGVDILWIMPVNPIGKVKRKGKLGSYYSVKNYKKVNPRFGSMQDFKTLVQKAHSLDMKVILDWVPNHTAWDNPWIKQHPDYYMKDSTGAITHEADWTDIAQLNYGNKDLWTPMIKYMKFWVKETDIDGYRMDHAGHDIPLDFWKKAIPEVDKVKKGLFWLAEWNTPEMHPWFDATYSWKYFHLIADIAKGKASLNDLNKYMANNVSLFSKDAYRIYFTSNHDENSWNGTGKELFGKNFKNFIVLSATIDGMPLTYGGQETGLDKRLAFFKKDPINWDDYKYESLYHFLNKLKEENEALWNGQYGGGFSPVQTNPQKDIYAFNREKGENNVLVILNFSDSNKNIKISNFKETTFTNPLKNEKVILNNDPFTINAHDFLILTK